MVSIPSFLFIAGKLFQWRSPHTRTLTHQQHCLYSLVELPKAQLFRPPLGYHPSFLQTAGSVL